MTPEQQARQQIDAELIACGWVIQDYAQFNPAAARGIALREVPLKSGRCDYLLLVDRKSLGIIEAKKEGTLLSGVSEQTAHYAVTTPAFFKVERDELPFLYESTGVETFFRNTLDPEPRSRHVFTFHKPETLMEWASQADTLRARLAKMPTEHSLPKAGMRDCQVEGITHLEQSFPSVAHRSQPHDGTMVFEIIGEPAEKLRGVYWTARKTTGEVVLSYRTRDRLDEFPSDLGEHPVSATTNP